MSQQSGLSNISKFIIIIIASALSVAPFVILRIPPVTDLPSHLLVSFIIKEYSNPLYHFSDFFNLQLSFSPNVVPQLILSYLMYLLSPVALGKAISLASRLISVTTTIVEIVIKPKLNSKRPALIKVIAG